jgi:hypothetical protein
MMIYFLVEQQIILLKTTLFFKVDYILFLPSDIFFRTQRHST